MTILGGVIEIWHVIVFEMVDRQWVVIFVDVNFWVATVVVANATLGVF